MIIFLLFFILIGSNGLILGNDPAVHLQHAYMFFETGHISLGDVSWFPPLYHIILDTFIAFTGTSNVEQVLFLMKAITALLNVLFLLSIYLLGTKFFNNQVGVFASLLTLFCFPIFELNFWGGYTRILSLTFMVLMFLYLALVNNDLASSVIASIFAFSVVLSHQLVTFLTLIILLPFAIILFKQKRSSRKMWIATLLGGAIAFFIYYFQAIIPHLDILIEHVFFQIKTNLYQLPSVSLNAFLTNFGFIIIFSFIGLIIAFIRFRNEKRVFLLFLSLSFFTPLFLTQSYLFGVYLPYHMFKYYMLPSLAVLAAVCLCFFIDIIRAAYVNNQKKWRRLILRIFSIAIICILVTVTVVRFNTVSEKIDESAVFYATSDLSAYDAGLWLRNSYPDLATVVVTEKPGSWFGIFSGKYTIAQTDLAVDRIVVAECVLDMAYEIEHPLTLTRVYDSKDDISMETYVLVNGIWKRSMSLSEADSYVSFYDANNDLKTYPLSSLNKEVALNETSYSAELKIDYSNSEFVLTENVLVQNSTYSITVTWSLSPLKTDIDNVILYLSSSLPSFLFTDAYIPNALDWESPWNNPTMTRDDWANTGFTSNNFIVDPYIGILDHYNQTDFYIKFLDAPNSGNIGVLSNNQIDAIRFQYNFDKVKLNQTTLSTYQLLNFAESSFSDFEQVTDFRNLFNHPVEPPFSITPRSCTKYIEDWGIKFLVHNIKNFDNSLLKSGRLRIIYSNEGYIITKVKATSNP